MKSISSTYLTFFFILSSFCLLLFSTFFFYYYISEIRVHMYMYIYDTMSVRNGSIKHTVRAKVRSIVRSYKQDLCVWKKIKREEWKKNGRYKRMIEKRSKISMLPIEFRRIYYQRHLEDDEVCTMKMKNTLYKKKKVSYTHEHTYTCICINISSLDHITMLFFSHAYVSTRTLFFYPCDPADRLLKVVPFVPR